MAKSVSPPLAHRAIIQQRPQSSTSKLAKYQVPRYPEEAVLRQQGTSNKPILQRSSISYVEPTIDDNKKKENNKTGMKLFENNTQKCDALLNKLIAIVICILFRLC